MPFLASIPAAASAAAAHVAVVTPTIDELEQASFYASGGGGGSGSDDDRRRVLLHHHQDQFGEKTGPSIPTLDEVVDAALPGTFFLSPSKAVDGTLEGGIGKDQDTFESIASLASVAAAASFDSAETDGDVMDAAGILCHIKRATPAAEDAADILELAVDMLSDETTHQDDAKENFWEPPLELENDSSVAESIVHPDRLAIEDDAEEVNKLHQFVRSDLLEIFVIPRDPDGGSSADSDEDDDIQDAESKAPTTSNAAAADGTRRLVTRRRSVSLSVPAPTTAAQRHYPGRVGLRCVHCARVRRPPQKSQTSKAAFYPLRLKNIYREVCAWQRIHFKRCPHVPHGVRERYDHYKRIDTSRGKVRYWETSARRIGLVNNPDR